VSGTRRSYRGGHRRAQRFGRTAVFSLDVAGHARFDPFAPVTLDALMAESDTHLYEAKRRRVAARGGARNDGLTAS
jgi:hypothetical protein